MWLGQLAIGKAYRGFGFGNEVVTGLKIWAIQEGFNNIQLGVFEKNEQAIKFWRRNNFTKTIKISTGEEFIVRTLECQLGEK